MGNDPAKAWKQLLLLGELNSHIYTIHDLQRSGLANYHKFQGEEIQRLVLLQCRKELAS